MQPDRARISIIVPRAPVFRGACVAIGAGVLLHVPMLAFAHDMGNPIVGMPTDVMTKKC